MVDALTDAGVTIDDHLAVFIRLMRYLYPFFPADPAEGASETLWYLPFTVEVITAADRLERYCEHVVTAWPEVWRSHPAIVKTVLEKPVVVVTGTLHFFDVMARHTWPLGKLARGNAFWERPENLHIFTKALSLLAGENVIFLYGGTNSITDVRDVAGTLVSGLLSRSDAYQDGSF